MQRKSLLKSATLSLATGLASGAAPALVAGVVLAPVVAWGQASADTPDSLIMRSGQVLKGKVIEETDTRVKFLLVSGGIKAETWYEKTNILKIERSGATPEAPKPADAARPAGPALVMDPAKKPMGGDATKVYVIELKGKFGEDITQTPIRDAVKDARTKGADVIVVTLENEWAVNELEKLPDDAAAFDEMFRAEQITPIFVREIPLEWEKQPKVVFWVKQALGGAAFMPFVCPNIYMTSEARIGGIGNLSTLFGGMGDEVVRQKQYSLRLGHAQGWAIVGGYEPKLITAMTRVEYVLSCAFEGGRPTYYERYPETPGELLLTDDGKDANEDNLRELVTGAGNDVLTIDADLGKKLLVSKGTVDNLDDLLFELGVMRNYQRVDGRSSQIMTGWSSALTDAKRSLRRLWEEFGEVQVEQPGGYTQRTQARGKRMAKIDEMQRILKRYKESITGQFHNQYGIPTSDQLDLIKEQIRQEQMADKR